MKEKIEDKLNKELLLLVDENEKNITSLKENILYLDEIESSISHNSNSNLNELSKQINNMKILKEDFEELNDTKNIYSIIDKSNSDETEEIPKINKLIVETLNLNLKKNKNNTSNILLIFNSITKLISNNKKELENWFVKIKFPLFEGSSLNSILTELNKNHTDKIKFFSEYFEILFLLVSQKEFDDDYYKDELFTSFLSKKVIFTLLEPFLKNNCDALELERELLELIDLIVRYTTRLFANFFNFIYFSLSQTNVDQENNQVDHNEENKIRVESISIQKFFIKNIIHQINFYLEKNFEDILGSVSSKPEILLKIIKKISDFNKILKKEYGYDLYIQPSFCDVLIAINKKPQYIDNLNELIRTQKAFTTSFIKNHLKSKLTETIEKNEFITIEIFELMKMIIKDNYTILLCFAKYANIFEASCENFYSNSFKELLGLFRRSYNEEFQIFSSKKSISRKKIIFILDLIIKFLLYTNKLYDNLTRNSENSKIIEIFSNSFNYLIIEINKMIENYTTILSKELRANGFEEMINFYTYDNLSKLSEEKIEVVFTQVTKLLKGLHLDLESVKIGIESENYFLKTFILFLLGRIIEECEKSLKKIPKNKFFNILTEKTNRIIEDMLSRFTINSDTMSVLKKPIEEIRKCFLSLNMNKI